MGTLFYACRKAEKIDTHLKTFFDIAQEMEPPQSRSIEEETGLVFDPRQYLASTRVRTYLFLVCKMHRHVSKTIMVNRLSFRLKVPLTTELKVMMTLASEYRTPEMIQKVYIY